MSGMILPGLQQEALTLTPTSTPRQSIHHSVRFNRGLTMSDGVYDWVGWRLRCRAVVVGRELELRAKDCLYSGDEGPLYAICFCELEVGDVENCGPLAAIAAAVSRELVTTIR
jgi:hypothetical protein